jgi:hypothetical protein
VSQGIPPLLGDNGVWTQGLALTKQVFYHLICVCVCRGSGGVWGCGVVWEEGHWVWPRASSLQSRHSPSWTRHWAHFGVIILEMESQELLAPAGLGTCHKSDHSLPSS